MLAARSWSRALAIVAVASVAACAKPPRGQARLAPAAAAASPSGRVITPDAIARMNVVSAWDVVRRSGFMVTASSDRSGRASGLRSRRGRSSLLISHSDTPLIVLDGVRTADFRVLESVPARTLLFVRYLTAIEATVVQGTNSGGGLIELRTASSQ